MKSLLDKLIIEKLIDELQLKELKKMQQSSEKSIFELILVLNIISEKKLKKVLSDFLNIPQFNEDTETIDPSLIQIVPIELAKRHKIFPIRIENNTLLLAINNPIDIIVLDEIRIITKMSVKPILATSEEIITLIKKYYYKSDNKLVGFLEEIHNSATIEKIVGDEIDESELGKGTFDVGSNNVDDSKIMKLTNLILSEAVNNRATDIHIEPQEKHVNVRYRVDGALKSYMKVPNTFRSSLIARIKILTDLNIAETRSPQDGRTRILVNDRKVDLRISTIPTFYGEKIALRLLDQQEAKTDLLQLGFKDNELQIITEAVTRPQGIILTTGPTGSGKTSTLYAALNHVRKTDVKNIVTIEDPIEYLMDGVNQIQLNPIKNVTFSSGLKSILRQDPNVILVGEIRDRETAEIAFRSALTGHLVLSTLHTNSSIATITRLLDIGLESYLIASSLILIIAQRLVKLICPQCTEQYIPEKELIEKFKSYINEFNIKKFYHGKGCTECNYTGNFGRTAVFEILKINEKIKYLISRKAPEDIISREAQRYGLQTLVKSGMEKVALGLTTMDEVMRIADVNDFEISEYTLDLSKEAMKFFANKKEGV